MHLLRLFFYVWLAFMIVMFIPAWFYSRRDRTRYAYVQPTEYFSQRIADWWRRLNPTSRSAMKRWQDEHCTHAPLFDVCPQCAAEYAMHLGRLSVKKTADREARHSHRGKVK